MSTRYTSSDGIMRSSDPQAVALWEDICARREGEQERWSTYLKSLHVKLEHPDDGWVHPMLPLDERGDGNIHPSYPRFNLRPEVGDLIALGAPYSRAPWKYRLVRVTEVERIPMTCYHYEDTGQRLPEPARRRWWRRGLMRPDGRHA